MRRLAKPATLALLLSACHALPPPQVAPPSRAELAERVLRLCQGEAAILAFARVGELSLPALAALEREWATARGAYGACTQATPLDDQAERHGLALRFRLSFFRADIPLVLSTDARGVVTGVRWDSPLPTHDSLAEVTADIGALAGKTSLLVTGIERSEDLAAHDAEAKLAVASAFKLSVLRTLLDEITAGRARWDEVVVLVAGDKSLPAGILQDWPAGTPITIKTAAILMMSMSDNTAANVLIRRLGRERIESGVGYRKPPLFTTDEMFKLRDKTSGQLARDYLALSGEGRRALLGRVAGVDLASLDADTDPSLVGEIEWFFSVRDLCGFMSSVRGLDVMTLANGSARRDEWSTLAFKGGTENAVAQFTYLVERKDDGSSFCVSGTWNNEAGGIDHKLFHRFGERVLGLVHALPSRGTEAQPLTH